MGDLMCPFQQDLIRCGANRLRDVFDNRVDRTSWEVRDRCETAEGGDTNAFGVAVVDEGLRLVDDIGMNLDL